MWWTTPDAVAEKNQYTPIGLFSYSVLNSVFLPLVYVSTV